MFLWGVISVFQVMFIPGFLFLKYIYKKELNGIQVIVYSSALSLYLNYQFSLISTYFGLFTFTTLVFLYSTEFSLFLILLKTKKISFGQNKINTVINNEIKIYSNKPLFLISWMCILFYTALFIANIGSIFYFNDSYTWNKWAAEWAANSFPTETKHYPQLLPTNWSIIYVTIHNSILHFFSKAIMPVFFIYTLLLFYDLTKKEENNLFLVGLIIYSLLMPLLYSLIFIADGNTEILVGFYGFLTFYIFYVNRKELITSKDILLAVLFSSSAALTKLAGSYIAFLSVIWLIYLLFHYYDSLSARKILLTISGVVAVYLFNLLWYLIKPMYKGLDQSVYLGDNIWQIIIHAYNLLSGNVGVPVFYVLCLLVVFSLFNKKINLITIILILPVIYLWSLFFSYDTRNLNISLPFIAMVVPFGYQWVKRKIKINNLLPDNKKKFKLLYPILFISILLFSISFLSNEILSNITVFLNRFYFRHIRINYMVEVGYEKYFWYFTSSVRILSLLLILLLLIRSVKIITNYIFILLVVMIAAASIYVDSDKLQSRQIYEEKSIALRALSSFIEQYSAVTENVKVLYDNEINDRLLKNSYYDYIFIRSSQNLQIPKNYTKIYSDFGYEIFIK